MFTEIIVSEVIQCGDHFLFKQICPACKQCVLVGAFSNTCNDCLITIEKPYYRIPTDRAQWRLLAGTKRKRTLGKRLVQKIAEMQMYMCAYCSICIRTNQFNVEHVLPLAAGGSNKMENLVLSCTKCNQIAGSNAFRSFSEKREYILDNHSGFEKFQ